MKNEKTSRRVAAIAGRVLQHFANYDCNQSGRVFIENANGDLFQVELTVSDMRALAASTLTQ